jgi:hypothetical protein
MVTVTLEGDALCVRSPYNSEFVADIKSLPSAERKFDPARKVWLVSRAQSAKLSKFIAECYHEIALIPQGTVTAVKEQRIFEVRYIGLTKERATGEEPTAFGFVDGQWKIIFPESILRSWFADVAKPSEVKTLYSVLGVDREAEADAIKKSYRRLARQWHPDVCREPDAKEQFQKLQAAYEIIGDPTRRAKYEAGLKLEASLKREKIPTDNFSAWSGYRSPLRCGLILCDCIATLGRFKVEKIHVWDDITNSKGQTLVSSWIMGDDKPLEVWS